MTKYKLRELKKFKRQDDSSDRHEEEEEEKKKKKKKKKNIEQGERKMERMKETGAKRRGKDQRKKK